MDSSDGHMFIFLAIILSIKTVIPTTTTTIIIVIFVVRKDGLIYISIWVKGEKVSINCM